jgi:DNA repair protein RadA/Sms
VKCIHCGHQLADGKYRCVNPKCGMWNVAEKTVSVTDNVVSLDDAKLAMVTRVPTGIVDKCFGPMFDDPKKRGIARMSVNLLGGDPGAGKTTLCLQLSDLFIDKCGGKVLYIANEQDPSELKTTSERLKLKHKRDILIVKAMGGIVADLGQMILHYKPVLLILDSVTKWAGEDAAEAVIICQRIKDYMVRIDAPAIVINQVTKSGDHSGLNRMQHGVDSTMLLETLGDNPEDPRRLSVRKNRNGPAPISQYFEMTPLGVFGITEEMALARLEGRPMPELPSDEPDEENEEDEDENGEDDDEDDES